MRLDILWDAGPAIIIHTLCALVALVLGTAMFLRKKGTPSHKLIGKIFVMFMAVTAASALFITGLNGKYWSPIHLFVPLTFYAIWELFHYIRKGNIKKHEKAVKGLFFGALLIPGMIAMMPGRRMWHILFGVG